MTAEGAAGRPRVSRGDDPAGPRGDRPPLRKSDRTRLAILGAARRQFTAVGYDKASVRAIAGEAGIDPSMVIRYFGSKDGLFAAALAVDLALPDLAAVPPADRGRALAEHFVRRWEGELHDDALALLLRSAAINAAAAERVQQVFADQLVGMIAGLAPPAEAPRRAGLVATQVLGLALCRYLLRLPPVVAMAPAELARWVGPTLQRYLCDPLD
ncbi:TetR family transcriptional regulator [Plantactinospora siamensis]|uniref:TetR family transcriptional regulator n=1 Tax=Plantactinospora siamensis TaxID=555372 RepID=A0ABV6P0G8_9ACTN